MPVYAVTENRYTPLACSRYLKKAFVWKRWPIDRDEFIKALAAISQTINRPAILIPIDDLSAVLVAENASILDRWFLFPHLPRDLPRRLANKANLYSLCAEMGIPCGQNITPRSADDIREFIKSFAFPIVVKSTQQWRLAIGSSTKLIASRDELFDLYAKIGDENFSEIILQEYLPGEDWIYHGYSDAEANLHVSFTGRKLLSYPFGAGSTAAGISVNNEVLVRTTEAFLKKISYTGMIDIDWRLDKRDGQFKILDCNPRVGQNFRMFETTLGIDVVRAQHLALSGRPVEYTKMIEGRSFIVESYRFLSFIRGRWKQSTAAAAENREFAWWVKDDKWPFSTMSLLLFFQTAKNSLRYLWNMSSKYARIHHRRLTANK